MTAEKIPPTLLEAVETGDLKHLRELIKAGAELDESCDDSALSKAAELGRPDMVRELLKAGADADFGGLHVPLCAAAQADSMEIVEMLLKAGAKVDAQEEGGESALMLAAARGDLKLVKRLLKAGANPKLQDEDGKTAILYGRQSPEIVKLLKPLSTSEDVEFLANEAKKTAAGVEQLLAAAQSGNGKRVKELLDAGTLVDGADKAGETALHIAVNQGDEKLLELLLKAGAKVDVRNQSGRTPLWEAAGRRAMKLAERLIQAGADVNAREKVEGLTPFLRCIGAEQDHLSMMRLLARHGADLRAVDNYGRTAFGLADRHLGTKSYFDKEERMVAEALRGVFVELGLLHKDANEYVQAAAKGDLKSARRFVEAGVPVDAPDEQERSALYMAVSRQHAEVVRFLLKAGADVHKTIGGDDEEDVQWGGITCSCPGCGHDFVAVLVERKCSKCGKAFVPQKAFGPHLDGEMCFSWSTRYLPLMAAAKVNNSEIIGLLIGAGADPDRGKEGLSPLMIACYYGHMDAAQSLIENGADVKQECKTPDRSKKLVSPISLAANGKHLAIVKLLWEAGVPAKDKRPTLLVAAAERGDLKEIADLIVAGANLNLQDPLTNEWPLSVAASAGQSAAVTALLQAGASVNPPGCKFSPLMSAVGSLECKKRQGKAKAEFVASIVAIAKELLAVGAKPNVSCFGISPLSLAGDMKCKPLVEVLSAALPPPASKKTKK